MVQREESALAAHLSRCGESVRLRVHAAAETGSAQTDGADGQTFTDQQAGMELVRTQRHLGNLSASCTISLFNTHSPVVQWSPHRQKGVGLIPNQGPFCVDSTFTFVLFVARNALMPCVDTLPR